MGEGITFRLTNNLDPEERLEEAALWKAVYDASAGSAVAVTGSTSATFGRLNKSEGSAPLRYWEDPSFLLCAKRHFCVRSLEEAFAEVRRMHDAGVGAFVKSTRDKHAIFRCPVGQGLRETMGDLIYSFIDGGPALMVQELASIEYEWRFFCVDRKIVADSTNHPSLTPLDYPQRLAFRTPDDDRPLGNASEIRDRLLPIAEQIAPNMQTPSAVIDCAFINGEPGCVELNPLRLGQVGLFACDVRALASAAIAKASAS